MEHREAWLENLDFAFREDAALDEFAWKDWRDAPDPLDWRALGRSDEVRDMRREVDALLGDAPDEDRRDPRPSHRDCPLMPDKTKKEDR